MRRIIENIIKVVVILLVITWIIVIFVDFFRTRNDNDPMFCISEKVTKYKDGETYQCTGLGYKMFRYNRTCSGVNFGPFFIKELDSKNDVSEELCLRVRS